MTTVITHPHPLELLDSTQETLDEPCVLCYRRIWSKAYYTCKERCEHAFYHRTCVEAPPQIDSHPLHPLHPLTLVHNHSFDCDACPFHHSHIGSFRCVECDFNLDICCALSTLSDEGCPQGGKTSEQITLPLHPHTLTSFSTRHDFVWNIDCHICRKSVQGDGYTCLCYGCEFVIHKRCIQDLYYADGTKAPRVYHGHPLVIFVQDTDSITCASCTSHGSGEFIGCSSCQVFYHRHCFQVPEILQYPSHDPDHTFVLFRDIANQPQCQSCFCSMKDEIYYWCTSGVEFFVHVECALRVLAYCEEGMSGEIELSWHKHPLLLCHSTESALQDCIYCKDKSIGPSYACQQKDCRFLLHKQCTEIESTIKHPHHPDHPLILCQIDDDDLNYYCKACYYPIFDFMFSCERCLVHLHLECAACFSTQKHYLHEHKLLQFEENSELKCNRCSKSTDSPVFRCVPCNFNLHEECMELPQKVSSKIHWHHLTLHETFVEDDSGEYYCEECEKTRDPRLGAYVCGECELIPTRIYHIECAIPELAKVYAKNSEERLASEFENLNEQIADKKEEVQEIRRELDETTQQLEETTRELDELKNQHNILLKRLSECKRSSFCVKEETPMKKVKYND